MLTDKQLEQIKVLATMQLKRMYLTPDTLRQIHENTHSEQPKDESFAVVTVTPAFAEEVQLTIQELLADIEALKAAGKDKADNDQTDSSI